MGDAVRLYWSGATALELFVEDGYVVDVTSPLSWLAPALELTSSSSVGTGIQVSRDVLLEYGLSELDVVSHSGGALVQVDSVESDDLYVSGDVGTTQLFVPPPGALRSMDALWLYNRAREVGASRPDALASIPLLCLSAEVWELFETLLQDDVSWLQAARLAAEVHGA